MPINDQGDEMRISGLGNTAKLQWLPDTPLFSYHTQAQTGPVVVDIVVVVERLKLKQFEMNCIKMFNFHVPGSVTR